MSPALVLLLVDISFGMSAIWLSYVGRDEVAFWTWVALGCLAAAQILLYSVIPVPSRSLKVQLGLRRAHLIQMPLQLSLYCYWGLYWGEVSRHVPFLIAQLVLAFGMDSLLSLWRRRVWQAGFGPVPIVLSTNLFLWARDDYAWLQFSLIAVAYLAKEFLVWNRDGRVRHIFNPSAFPLALLSLVLLVTGSAKWTHGVDIVGSFDLPPSFYEVVFMTGIVVQLVFFTTWISLGAVGTLIVIDVLSRSLFGISWGPTAFDPSVLLGATLLVTDPATSPGSRAGKLMFGMTYGLLVFLFCIGLRWMNLPSYFDKILPVPLVNLLVSQLDHLGLRIEAAWAGTRALKVFQHRLIPVALYAGIFWLVLPSLKNPNHTGHDPLPGPAVNFSDAMARQVVASHACRIVLPEVYRPFAFSEEYRRYEKIRKLFAHASASN